MPRCQCIAKTKSRRCLRTINEGYFCFQHNPCGRPAVENPKYQHSIKKRSVKKMQSPSEILVINKHTYLGKWEKSPGDLVWRFTMHSENINMRDFAGVRDYDKEGTKTRITVLYSMKKGVYKPTPGEFSVF